ncbi:MAG: FAD-dependent monooxygenase [Actinobacteria bacterium]|nr:FAD-dependent monooxygenase [Actinomycetota bacterium]MDI6830553.1 FAD-dependent monooxygenase [Actinomycetota bacterium]
MRGFDYDLVVVGGGPAGAAAAKAAKEGGLRVLLLEKKRMPRLKPCAGYLFKEAREFLQAHYPPVPAEVMCRPSEVRGINLYLDRGFRLEVEENGLSVWRDRFDRWLCESSGAEVWDGARLVDFCEWSDRVEVLCVRDGRQSRLTARALVAADGGLSMVTRRIDPWFPEGAPYICVRHEYHRCETELEPGVFHVFMDAAYGVYPACYFKDDLMVVDTSVRRGERIGPTRAAFLAMLRRDFGFRSREAVMTLGCRAVFPAAINRFCLGTGRVLVAGEAAGFMNSLGEGISSALSTGRLAGLAAAECGRSAPGALYRAATAADRERTAREWSLLTLLRGGVRPELRRALGRLSLGEKARFLRGVLAWQRGGGVAPGLNREALETALRRLLRGSYDFRA